MSIIVATDLSEHSQDAVRWASAYAADADKSLNIAYIIDTLGDDELWTALFETPDEIERRVLTSASERVTQFATDVLQGVPTPSTRRVLVAVGPPAAEIESFAREKGVDLIVSGTSGHGRLRNALFGSTAHRLTQQTRRPIVYVPAGSSLPPAKNLLVALDFSDCSLAALRWAAEQAKQWDAVVTAVHGLGVSALSPDYEPNAKFVPMIDALTEQRHEQLTRQLTDHGIEGKVIISRASPAEAIGETAESVGAELIVMGTHGRGAVGRLLLGSVALRVLRDTTCPVATIQPAE